jgi:hypothetical protein
LGGANMPIKDVFKFLKGWEVEIPFKFPLSFHQKIIAKKL